jgi:hypothetical protein
MNKFFIMDEKVAKSLDCFCDKAVEYVYQCCAVCDDGPIAIHEGWIVSTSLSEEEVCNLLVKNGDLRERWVMLEGLDPEFVYHVE